MDSCTIYELSSRATQQRRRRHWDATANIKSNSFHVHHSAPFLSSFTPNALCHLFMGDLMGTSAEIAFLHLWWINKYNLNRFTAHVLFFYFLGCTDKCQAKKKPTDRARLLAAKVLFFGSTSDSLSVICQKGVRNDPAATSGSQSAWSQFKWEIGVFYTDKLCLWVSRRYTSILCLQLSSHLVFPRWLLWHLVGWEGVSLSLQHHGEPDVLGQHCQLPRPGTHVSVCIMCYHYLHN